MTQALLATTGSGSSDWTFLIVFGAISVIAATWFIVLMVRPTVIRRPIRGDDWSDHDHGRLSRGALDRRRFHGLIPLIVLIVIWWRILVALSSE